jgi:hypothetical protein
MAYPSASNRPVAEIRPSATPMEKRTEFFGTFMVALGYSDVLSGAMLLRILGGKGRDC